MPASAGTPAAPSVPQGLLCLLSSCCRIPPAHHHRNHSCRPSSEAARGARRRAGDGAPSFSTVCPQIEAAAAGEHSGARQPALGLLSPQRPCGLRVRQRGNSPDAGKAPVKYSYFRHEGYMLNRKSKCTTKKLFTTTTGAKLDDSDFDSVHAPLEPQTWEGSFLCGLLKSQPHVFLAAAAKQLQQMSIERKDTQTRWEHSIGSSEDCLHRRIAKMKEQECRTAIEDVMYMLIVHKYFKIEVPMVPNLSKLISNRRLHIWPPREEDLESIHGPEVLGLIREHLTSIIRWVHKNGPKINRSTLRVKRLQLGRIYSASIMYGYFLKSVTLRHSLDLTLARPQEFLQPIQLHNAQLATTQKQEKKEAFCGSVQMLSSLKRSSIVDLHDLKSYIMGFDPKTLELCAKVRSNEASNLIEKHSRALFGGSIEIDEAVILDPASLKRLLLEAIAFGSFLWDIEDNVDEIFKFQDS